MDLSSIDSESSMVLSLGRQAISEGFFHTDAQIGFPRYLAWPFVKYECVSSQKVDQSRNATETAEMVAGQHSSEIGALSATISTGR